MIEEPASSDNVGDGTPAGRGGAERKMGGITEKQRDTVIDTHSVHRRRSCRHGSGTKRRTINGEHGLL